MPSRSCNLIGSRFERHESASQEPIRITRPANLMPSVTAAPNIGLNGLDLSQWS